MAFTKDQIEYLHNTGQMSDWAYYQTNGKTLQENYTEIRRRQAADNRRLLEERRQQKANEAALEAEIEKRVGTVVEKTLSDLLKALDQH